MATFFHNKLKKSVSVINEMAKVKTCCHKYEVHPTFFHGRDPQQGVAHISIYFFNYSLGTFVPVKIICHSLKKNNDCKTEENLLL